MNGIDFVKRLKTILKEKGILQTKMLIDLGIPKSSMSNWEQRGNVPSADIVYKIAKYLNVPMETLLYDDKPFFGKGYLEYLVAEGKSEEIYKHTDPIEEDLKTITNAYSKLSEASKAVVKDLIISLFTNVG